MILGAAVSFCLLLCNKTLQKQLLDSRSYSIGPGTKPSLPTWGPLRATQLMLRDPRAMLTHWTLLGPQAASPALSPASKGKDLLRPRPKDG